MPQILSLVAYPGGFPHSFDVLREISNQTVDSKA